MELPRLYAIVDVEASTRAGRRAYDVAVAYLSGGARLLQLRAKTLASGAFLDLAGVVADAVVAAGARLIVNDRADIARLVGAGVHVGQQDLSPGDARRVLGPHAIVGVSTHTPPQIEAAIREPVSYVAVGPVFHTSTKATGYTAAGLSLIEAAVRLAAPCGLPVVAIGGITLDRAPGTIEAGAASVAVITDLLTADPEARVREYLSALA